MPTARLVRVTRLKDRSTALRSAYSSASKPGGRLPAEPLTLRRAIWSMCSGMVCLICLPRRKVRVLGWEYVCRREPDIQVVARVGEGLDEGQSIGLSPAVTSREQDEHRRAGQVRQGLDFGGQPAHGAARRVVGGSPGTIRDFL